MNEQLKDIIKDYNQFTWSRLHDDIITVLNCSKQEAKDKALTMCNMVSLWAGLKVQEYIHMDYADFFKLLLTSQIKISSNVSKLAVTKSGFFNVGKDLIMKQLFDIDFNLKYYEDFEDIINPSRLNRDSLYQMKIDNSMHFIICSVDQSGIFLIYDTGLRGVGVPAIGSNRIKEPYFKWLMEIKQYEGKA